MKKFYNLDQFSRKIWTELEDFDQSGQALKKLDN